MRDSAEKPFARSAKIGGVSFDLPLDIDFQVVATSKSNRLQRVFVWLLGNNSYLCFEQRHLQEFEFGRKEFRTTNSSNLNLRGFSVNVRVESKSADGGEEWRASKIRILLERHHEKSLLALETMDAPHLSDQWKDTVLLFEPMVSRDDAERLFTAFWSTTEEDPIKGLA